MTRSKHTQPIIYSCVTDDYTVLRMSTSTNLDGRSAPARWGTKDGKNFVRHDKKFDARVLATFLNKTYRPDPGESKYIPVEDDDQLFNSCLSSEEGNVYGEVLLTCFADDLGILWLLGELSISDMDDDGELKP